MPQNNIDTKAGLPHEHWIKQKYGSRRGLVRTLWHQLLYITGRYRNYRNIDWNTVERLVFVCKGNICRSAFAEYVARKHGIQAISLGLDTIENAPANIDAQKAAKELGYDLSQHKTTPVMYVILKKTDLLVAMEPWQADFLTKHLCRNHQCTLLGLWNQPALPHIQDPYGASSLYFERCFTLIQQGVRELVGELKSATRVEECKKNRLH